LGKITVRDIFPWINKVGILNENASLRGVFYPVEIHDISINNREG
jgi:hypothetical protein